MEYSTRAQLLAHIRGVALQPLEVLLFVFNTAVPPSLFKEVIVVVNILLSTEGPE